MSRKAVGLVATVILIVAAVASFGLAAAQDSPSAWLGVGVQPAEDGALVMEVAADSPAAAAGLQAGDVIVSVNGESVTANTIGATIGAMAVGDTVTIEVTRNGESVTLTATLAERPAEMETAPRTRDQFMMLGGFLGITVEEADGQVTVTNVMPGSPAAEAGLQAGDVLTSINGEPVDDIRGLAEMLNSLAGGEPVTLDYTRDGEPQSAEIPMVGMIPRGGGERRGGGDRRGGDMPFDFGAAMPMFGGGARLGVVFVQLNADVAAEQNVEQTEGALVTEVVEDSPAAEAGLLAGDVVLAVDGDVVDEERTLRDRLFAYEPEDTITLSVLRDGETLDVQVTLDAAEAGMGMPFMMPFGRGDHGDMPFFNIPFDQIPGHEGLAPEMTPEATDEAPRA